MDYMYLHVLITDQLLVDYMYTVLYFIMLHALYNFPSKNVSWIIESRSLLAITIRDRCFNCGFLWLYVIYCVAHIYISFELLPAGIHGVCSIHM